MMIGAFRTYTMFSVPLRRSARPSGVDFEILVLFLVNFVFVNCFRPVTQGKLAQSTLTTSTKPVTGSSKLSRVGPSVRRVGRK